MLYNLTFKGQDLSVENPQSKTKQALVYAESVTEAIANLTKVITEKRELALTCETIEATSKSQVARVYFSKGNKGDFFRVRCLIKQDHEKNEQEFNIFQATSMKEASDVADAFYKKQDVDFAITHVSKITQLVLADLVSDQGEVLEMD